MNHTVRAAELGDVEALVTLNRWVQELHVAGQPDYFKVVDESAVRDWFASMLENATVRVWLAESAGSPAGYALIVTYDRPENTFKIARSFCEIDQIVVSPAFRRQGIARALVGRALSDARSRGIPDLELTSWCFNAEAHGAFRALGFEPKRVRFWQRSSSSTATG